MGLLYKSEPDEGLGSGPCGNKVMNAREASVGKSERIT